MKKVGGHRVVDLIWKLCNIAFESGVVPEDLRSAVTVPLYKGKVEIAECGNYKGLSFLSVVGKIYAENGLVTENWRSAEIVLLYKRRGLNARIIEVFKCVWKNIFRDIIKQSP